MTRVPFPEGARKIMSFHHRVHTTGIRPSTGAATSSLRQRVQTGSGAHPASYKIGTGGYLHGGKLPGREADHSPPSSSEVKNASTPPYVFMARCLIKHRDNFTSTLTVSRGLLCPPCLLSNGYRKLFSGGKAGGA
jgi:hypothetical protein